jgi:hypothetical protein
MSVQMIRDTREGLLDSPLLPPLEDWLSFLQAFGEKLWAMFAEEYDLKSCSNPVRPPAQVALDESGIRLLHALLAVCSKVTNPADPSKRVRRTI